MQLGKNGKWMWVSAKSLPIWAVINRCPLLVCGRFVQITAFDGSPLVLNEREREKGWTNLGSSIVTTRITLLEEVPCAEHDEWYIFHQKPQKEIGHVFVNYLGFRLTAGHAGLQQIDELAEETMFWEQLKDIGPCAYICGGDNLVFVTSDGNLFESVLKSVQLCEWDNFEEQARLNNKPIK